MGSEFRGRKGKGPGRVNSHQVAFELKQRVVVALNKIADRDTYQLGVEELEKTIECLTPDGVASVFSCILDTDSVQKSAVRKECIKSMGLLATYHEGLVLPYLGKMVASIVKRLKDSDTVLRDTCVDTMGVLASKLGGDGVDNDGFFVALVKPLFEALGEQNKHVQSGSALCLARVIDNINDPPVSILQKMLARTVKLLKNPHFMAKPAVIELNRSIIQAGGAATRTALSAAIASIQETLKNSDWLTRKAASAALGDIASSGGALFSTFRASSLRCLESCRFDKVKPVRETALQALQIWRDLPGSETPEPSEAGSSVKENFFRDEYHEVTSTCDSTPGHVPTKKTGSSTVHKRLPLSYKRSGQSPISKAPYSKADDWHMEVVVPKTTSVPDTVDEESQGSCITKTCERTSVDMRSTQDIEYECVQVEDNQGSSASLFHEKFECKALVCSDALGEVDHAKKTGRGLTYLAEEISTEEKRYTANIQNRCSLDSTVIESCSPALHCCSQTTNEMAAIRKHLLDIENKQTTLMDLFKMFTANIIDSMSMIQVKVSSLEDAINGVAQELVKEERYAPVMAAKLLKRNQDSCSPRMSTCTPRSSMDTRTGASTLAPKTADLWVENTDARSSSSSIRQGADMWTNPYQTFTKSNAGKGIRENVRYGSQIGKRGSVFPPVSGVRNRQNKLERKDDIRRDIRGYLSQGDLDSAYAEALNYSNELVLFELMDSTGPVLEHLSEKTAGDLLNILASYLSKQKLATSIFPWLQQVVDLTVSRGPDYVVVPQKQRAFLSAVEQVAGSKFSNPVERRFAAELAAALHQIWGKCS